MLRSRFDDYGMRSAYDEVMGNGIKRQHEPPRIVGDLLQSEDLVYIDYVETAPWNRKAIVDPPRFGGVGTIMIRAAIEVSRDQEFRGRIGLHSLPSAERFYADACGMTDLGLDGTYEGLRYFEMTSVQADAFSG